MKYKPGQRVRINSLDWYNENKNDIGDVLAGNLIFTQKMSKYCGCIITIKQSYDFYYVIEGANYCFNDYMIEGLIDEDNESESIDNTADLLPKYVKITRDMSEEQAELDITEEYEYVDKMGNVIDTAKIIIRKRKSKYPTTYEECCDILNTCLNIPTVPGWKGSKVAKLQQLLICRDAYWKINNWNPDWKDENSKFIIQSFEDEVGYWSVNGTSSILAFPTVEMRDTFYENFKDLINECKEFL